MLSPNLKPYRPRKIESVGVRDIGQWQLKVYTIKAPDQPVIDASVQAAMEFINGAIEWPSDSGCGFVTVHFGESIWLLVDLWADDILCHFLFRTGYENATTFGPPPAGSMACIWELEVTKHERDAWVRHVMQQPDQPNFDAYLGDTLEVAI